MKLFKQLPVASVVAHTILVIHGGILDANVRLTDLSQCLVGDYVGEAVSAERKRDMTRQELRLTNIMLGALWSDPDPSVKGNGVKPSERGAGSFFGAGATEQFLRKNDLSLIVRSHQVVPEGFEAPFATDRWDETGDCPSLVTVFSASDYSVRMHNKGAVVRFLSPSASTVRRETKLSAQGTSSSRDTEGKRKTGPLFAPCLVPRSGGLTFTAVSYSPKEDTNEELARAARLQDLRTQLLSKRNALEMLFASADSEGTGLVSLETWATVLAQATELDFDWRQVEADFIGEDALEKRPPKPGAAAQEEDQQQPLIRYEAFLTSSSLTSKAHASDALAGVKLDPVFTHLMLLKNLFKQFDTNHNVRPLSLPD